MRVRIENILPSILVTLSLLIFLPIMLQFHYPVHSNDDNNQDLDIQLDNSSTVKMVFASSIAVIFPFLFEFLFDYVHNNTSAMNNIYWNKSHRLSFLCFLLPDIYILVIGIPFKQYDFMQAFILWRDTALTIYLLSLLIKLGAPVWNFQSYIFIGIPSLVGNLIISNKIMFPAIDEYSLYIFEIIVEAIAIIYVMYCELQWVLLIHNTYEISLTTASYFPPINQLKKRDLLCLVHNISFIIYFYATWLPIFQYQPSGKWTVTLGTSFLTLYMIVVTLSVVSIYFISSQVARLELLEIKASLNTKRSFVREISHEIRTPLNCAYIGLDILTDSNLDMTAKDNKESLKDIKESLQEAIEILNQLLLFDKIESGTLQIENATFPIKELFKAITVFSLQASVLHVNYHCNINEFSEVLENYVIFGDIHKLKQVIRNVISNGLKFTSKFHEQTQNATVKINILPCYDQSTLISNRIYCMDSSSKFVSFNQLKIEISDNGPGISLDNQSKLFKTIVQFNPGWLQNGGGTGLGLFISKNIMEMHHGDISVQSEGEGCGCTFVITLPITYSATSMPLNPKQGSNECNINETIDVINTFKEIENTMSNIDSYTMLNTIENKSEMIQIFNKSSSDNNIILSTTTAIDNIDNNNKVISMLIVDDSEINRKMTCRLLNNRNHNRYMYNIIEYENGLDALNHISKEIDDNSNLNNNINIILIDNQMPIMDGITSVLLMRKKQYNGYIIMITGDSLEDDKGRMLQAGVNHILIKPINKDILFNLIDNYVTNQYH